MMWLIISIILNTYVGIVFKVFQRFGISNLQAIAINYFVCVCTGSIFLGFHPFNSVYLTKPYFWFAILQGFFFFVVFHLISKSTISIGVSATQVSNKLSLVIPVVLSYFLFKDHISILKIVGVILAGASVYLSSQKTKDGTEAKTKNAILLPVAIFVGSGLLDTLTSYIQFTFFKNPEDSAVYVIFCFASGFIFSTLFLCYQLYTKQENFVIKSFAGGILLGIPNFFSIFSFIKALDANYLQASALVPVNNIGVVFASAVCAIIFFKENLNSKNNLGLLLALLAIACIIIGDKY